MFIKTFISWASAFVMNNYMYWVRLTYEINITLITKHMPKCFIICLAIKMAGMEKLNHEYVKVPKIVTRQEIYIFSFVPCPSIGPNQIWSRAKNFWSCSNIILDWTKNKFSVLNFALWLRLKCFDMFQFTFNQSKTDLD